MENLMKKNSKGLILNALKIIKPILISQQKFTCPIFIIESTIELLISTTQLSQFPKLTVRSKFLQRHLQTKHNASLCQINLHRGKNVLNLEPTHSTIVRENENHGRCSKINAAYNALRPIIRFILETIASEETNNFSSSFFRPGFRWATSFEPRENI